MTPKERMEKTHNTLIDKYQSEPEIYNFIRDFFILKKGLRPFVIQKRFPKKIAPLRYFPSESKRMLFFNEFNTDILRFYKGQLHFLECIFDERIKDMDFLEQERKTANVPGDIFNQCVIGINPCIEIDYHIKGSTIFDKYKEAIYLKCLIEEKIEEMGFKSNSIFSGNGFYTVVKSYYFEELNNTLDDIKKNMGEFKNKKNREMKKKFKTKPIPLIDTAFETIWSKYHKIPFTYHNKYNRVSLPISNGEVDKDYLKTISNFDNFINLNTNEINSIIHKANWREIW